MINNIKFTVSVIPFVILISILQFTQAQIQDNEPLTEYVSENLGLKLNYPSTWWEVEEPQFLDSIHLFFNSSSEPQLRIFAVPQEENKPEKDTLLEYVKDQYYPYNYLNDNQTKISNHTAIQTEYVRDGNPTLYILTKNGDIFYHIIYSEENGDIIENKQNYASNLKVIKKIIDSIVFKYFYEDIPVRGEVVPFFTNTTLSIQRGYPSFLNATDLNNPKFLKEMDTPEQNLTYHDVNYINPKMGIELTYSSNWDIDTLRAYPKSSL